MLRERALCSRRARHPRPQLHCRVSPRARPRWHSSTHPHARRPPLPTLPNRRPGRWRPPPQRVTGTRCLHRAARQAAPQTCRCRAAVGHRPAPTCGPPGRVAGALAVANLTRGRSHRNRRRHDHLSGAARVWVRPDCPPQARPPLSALPAPRRQPLARPNLSIPAPSSALGPPAAIRIAAHGVPPEPPAWPPCCQSRTRPRPPAPTPTPTPTPTPAPAPTPTPTPTPTRLRPLPRPRPRPRSSPRFALAHSPPPPTVAMRLRHPPPCTLHSRPLTALASLPRHSPTFCARFLLCFRPPSCSSMLA